MIMDVFVNRDGALVNKNVVVERRDVEEDRFVVEK